MKTLKEMTRFDWTNDGMEPSFRLDSHYVRYLEVKSLITCRIKELKKKRDKLLESNPSPDSFTGRLIDQIGYRISELESLLDDDTKDKS